MSQAVIHGKTVYLAGQVASGDGVAAQTRGILAQMNGIWDGWVTAGATPARATVESAQTRGILAQIDALLAEAQSDKTRILSATIWLADMATFAEMNGIWDGWVTAGATPARATVESARLAAAEFKVEIAVIAAQI